MGAEITFDPRVLHMVESDKRALTNQPTGVPAQTRATPSVPAGAMDMRTFGRMFLGRKPGQQVSKEEFEADKKAYEYYIKKSIDNKFSPELLNTHQGLFARYDGTNAVAIAPVTTNAQGEVVRGEQLMGYAAEPSAAGGVTPTIGGGAFAGTNAPTAAPSPTPPQLRDGMIVRQGGVTYKIVNGQPVVVP